MCIYIYIVNIHSKNWTKLKQQLLFWMRLITINRLTALLLIQYFLHIRHSIILLLRTYLTFFISTLLLVLTLVLPRIRTTLGSRAFSHAAPYLWNSLPQDVRNSESLIVFKSLLKTHLFRQAFMWLFVLGLLGCNSDYCCLLLIVLL